MVAKSVVHQKCPVVHKVERAEMALAGWIITPSQGGVSEERMKLDDQNCVSTVL